MPDDFLMQDALSKLAEGSRQWIERLACSDRKRNDLMRFCHEMKDGDIVVLRRGRSEVFGVGAVEGGWGANHQFGDVDGWNIALVRRVRWYWKADATPRRFEKQLKWGDTTQPLKRSGSLWDWLAILEQPKDDSPLPVLADSYGQKTITIDEISEYLFDKGVASSAIQHLLDEIDELVRIAKWYRRMNHSPSEHETVAYLVVPLLKALGWTPQRMAVEWGRIDVALFDSLPRSLENVRVIVEVKKMNSACLVADEQAKQYAMHTPNCQRLILTDGLRYGVHSRQPNGEFKLDAYLNLTRMRDGYPVLGYAGAQEALRLMTP